VRGKEWPHPSGEWFLAIFPSKKDNIEQIIHVQNILFD
jgi:hypothetical protein